MFPKSNNITINLIYAMIYSRIYFHNHLATFIDIYSV